MWYCTEHFNLRVRQRGFCKQDILSTLRHGYKVFIADSVHVCYNGITIVVDGNKLITIYRGN